jgi:hypothetical protein
LFLGKEELRQEQEGAKNQMFEHNSVLSVWRSLRFSGFNARPNVVFKKV